MRAAPARRQKVSFTVVVTDNGTPGTLDTFSITSGIYSQSGNLTSDNILLH